jgi:hypothetical protein
LLSISDYLVDRHRRKLTTLLVVDEAHHLSSEVLEEIRLLTNLETPTQKLLQILLVGQPELNQKLDSSNLRQLKQRIALRCNLEPLSEEETRAYVKRRLQLAGSNPEVTIFTEGATSAIYRHSRGIPRLINTVCENALIAAYAHQTPHIEPEVIDEVASDLRLGVVTTESDDLAIEDSGDQLRRAANTLLQFHDFLQSNRSKQKPQVVVRRGIESMSRLFEALQRSEAERSGSTLPQMPSAATELLQAAEQGELGAEIAADFSSAEFSSPDFPSTEFPLEEMPPAPFCAGVANHDGRTAEFAAVSDC